MTARQQVVIVGGGFGGLYAAKSLKRANVDVTLLDRRNFHLFQPLLYQVALGGLSPANIASPLRGVLKRQANCTVLLAEVTDFDLAGKNVILSDGAKLPYDHLVVAAGSKHHYFGHPEYEPLAPGLKSIEDATEIRRRVLSAFEAAERRGDVAGLTFVVVGGGPTGMELAGSLAELARQTLRQNFRRIDPAQAKIILVEGQDRLLAAYDPKLSEKARVALTNLGVEVWLKATVTNLTEHAATVTREGQVQTIPGAVVLWGAGVQAAPLTAVLAKAAGLTPDRAGRIPINPDLTLANHPDVYAIGDMANLAGVDGKPLPGLAPVAMQQGKHAAVAIARKAKGDDRPADPFRYRDKGIMATIGRNSAVAQSGGIKLSGRLAWLAWLFIHVLYLVEFENRLLVLSQWFWNYLTRNRSARLITNERK